MRLDRLKLWTLEKMRNRADLLEVFKMCKECSCCSDILVIKIILVLVSFQSNHFYFI